MNDIRIDARVLAAVHAHLEEADRHIAWVPPLTAAGCGSADVERALADSGAWLQAQAELAARCARELTASLQRMDDAWRTADAALGTPRRGGR